MSQVIIKMTKNLETKTKQVIAGLLIGAAIIFGAEIGNYLGEKTSDYILSKIDEQTASSYIYSEGK